MSVLCVDDKLKECLKSGIDRWNNRKNKAMTMEAKITAMNYLDAYTAIAYQVYGLNDAADLDRLFAGQ